MKLKLVHVQLLPMMSGVQKVSLDEFALIDDDIYQKFLICKEEGPFTEEVNNLGVKVIFNRYLKREINVFSDLFSLFKFVFIFLSIRPDIVHTHSAKTGFLGRLAAKLTGVNKIVHTVHGFPFSSTESRVVRHIYILLERFAKHFTDDLICLHSDDAKIAIELLGYSPHKISILANGVDIDKYNLSTTKGSLFYSHKELGFSPDDYFIVTMVGRLWQQKNPHKFVDAGIELLKSNKNIMFILCGDGEMRQELEDKVKSHGFQDSFKFLGWRNDIPEILKISDLFILPSLWEGMPLAIIEAMASQTPCIVSNIPGNNSLIENEVNGLLFDLDESLSIKIEALISDEQLRHRILNNAYQDVLSFYDIKERIENISTIYS